MFHLVFVAAGFKPSAQKAEECLQKIRALQEEGWWLLLCCLFICAIFKGCVSCMWS